MMTKNNNFIQKAVSIHGYRYDYSKIDYVNNYSKIEIICSIHGSFYQKPNNHLKGQNCKKCVSDSQRYTTDIFIQKALNIHKGRYDYSRVDYIDNKTKVEIICPIHGSFHQTPINHINKKGCSLCDNDNRKNHSYINKCKTKFDNKYDYSRVEYENNKTKVEIICPIHGSFHQTLKEHLNSNGCPYCSGKKMNTELFISYSNKTHNFKYDYSSSEYKKAFDNIKIICPKHGSFQQIAYQHLQGKGCSLCKTSKGEKFIVDYLDKNGIKYSYQHKFKNCRYINLLVFDFYIESLNICIEYNGIQHYKCIEYFGGYENFETIKKRDNVKKDFCVKNNIILEIIRYDEDIFKRLENIFG